MPRSSSFARLAYLIILPASAALMSCAPEGVHVGALPDGPSPTHERIPLAVEIQPAVSHMDSVVRYSGDNHRPKIHYWDALKSVARKVPTAVFDSELARQGRALKLYPELVYLTDSWQGSVMWHDEVTRVVLRWTLTEAAGDTVWSSAFKGEQESKRGSIFALGDNLLMRNELAFNAAYESTVRGMLSDSFLWLYGDCEPLYGVPASEYAAVADELIAAATAVGRRSEALRAHLLFAAQESDPVLTRHLLAAGADLNRPFPHFGATPLSEALALGNYEFAAALIELGADVNQQVIGEQTLLNHVAMLGDDAAVEFLAEHDAGIVPIDTCGFTAMASGRALTALAGAAERRGDDTAADRFFAEAEQCYDSAIGHFSARADSFNVRKQRVESSEFMKSLLQYSLVTFVAWGEQYQAREQVRQSAQIAALQQASGAGTGIQGYYRAMQSYRAPAWNSVEFQAREEALMAQIQAHGEREQAEEARRERMLSRSQISALRQANEQDLASLSAERAARAKTGNELGQLVEEYETLVQLCKESAAEIRARSQR